MKFLILNTERQFRTKDNTTRSYSSSISQARVWDSYQDASDDLVAGESVQAIAGDTEMIRPE